MFSCISGRCRNGGFTQGVVSGKERQVFLDGTSCCYFLYDDDYDVHENDDHYDDYNDHMLYVFMIIVLLLSTKNMVITNMKVYGM